MPWLNRSTEKESFFVKDPGFFKSLFRIMVIVAFQNLINYSVNMADNIMLGAYGQTELSAAACVNQIFFILNAFLGNLGASFSVLAAQYWGQKRTDQINRLGGILLRTDLIIAILFFAAAAIIPEQLVRIFTSDPAIISQGVVYLGIIKYTFIPYAISIMFMDLLRNVETVSISFYMSLISLVINGGLNYLLIFGKAGLPRMGIAGAAVATLTSRVIEMIVLLIYVWKIDKKLHFFRSDFYKWNNDLAKHFGKIALSIVPAGVGWALATPVQTALLGRLSSDAIAANSVTSTFYQLLKVVAQAMGSASAVIIGKTIGEKDFVKARAGARTIQTLSLLIGLVLGLLLFVFRNPIISLYSLTPEAEQLTRNMILIMCFVIVGMSYEVPTLFGVIRAGGDARFPSIVNVAVTWGLSMPLAFMAVFWWNLSPEWVVIIIQGEQIAKCIPAFLRVRRYDKWIRVVAE